MAFQVKYNAGSNDQVPTVDAATHATNVVDYSHHEIHGGSAYVVIYSALKADTETAEVRFATPNTTKWAHMVITVTGALAGTAEMWEGTTKTHASGNAITPFNRNRNSSNTSGLTVCHTPSGSESAGATLTQYFGASTAGGRADTGGGASSRAEFILKQNTAYLLRATSRADGNAVSIILDWYEHTNK
jgi:hypothetical protein